MGIRLENDICLQAGCKRIVCVEPVECYTHGWYQEAVVEPDDEYFGPRLVPELSGVQRTVGTDKKWYLAVANANDYTVELKRGDIVGSVRNVNNIIEIETLNVETISDTAKVGKIETVNGMQLGAENVSVAPEVISHEKKLNSAQVVFPAPKDERKPLLVNDYARHLRLNLKNVFRNGQP